MTLSKMIVVLAATVFCTVSAIYHQQPYYQAAAEPYNYTGKSRARTYKNAHVREAFVRPYTLYTLITR